jgi:toxin ParE1/3/4
MARYRLSDAAQRDVLDILAWTHEQFGEAARLRYETLIVATLRDVASQPHRPGSLDRPELGAGARSWHLGLSRELAKPALDSVRRPRHFVVYRIEPGLVVISRILHDAMELARHLDADVPWE